MRIGHPNASTALAAVPAAAFALVAGWFSGSQHIIYLLALLVVLGVLWAVGSRFGTGGVAGLFVLGGVNALPGPDLQTRLGSINLTPQDFIVGLLVIVLLYENGSDNFSAFTTRIGRRLGWWTAIFLLWYGFTLVRTWVTTPVPIFYGLTFSRQFSYFALTLPLLYGAMRRPEFRRSLLTVLAAGALISDLAQIAAVAGHHQLPFLLHINYNQLQFGVTRIRGVASDIPFAALPLGYGLLLYGDQRRRLLGAALAISGVTAVALSLTRAMYLGVVVGLGFATLVALFGSGFRGRLARQRLTALALASLVGVGVVYFYAPSNLQQTALASISKRVSTLTDISSKGQLDPSLQARSVELADLNYTVGSHWLVGLGELDPTFDYQPTVVNGDISNSDISLASSASEIGVLGIAIYLLPLIGTAFALARDRLTPRAVRDDEWIGFGTLAWCVGVMVVSWTLGLMFDSQQVVGSATMIALALATLAAATEKAERGVPPSQPPRRESGRCSRTGGAPHVGPPEAEAGRAR